MLGAFQTMTRVTPSASVSQTGACPAVTEHRTWPVRTPSETVPKNVTAPQSGPSCTQPVAGSQLSTEQREASAQLTVSTSTQVPSAHSPKLHLSVWQLAPSATGTSGTVQYPS